MPVKDNRESRNKPKNTFSNLVGDEGGSSKYREKIIQYIMLVSTKNKFLKSNVTSLPYSLREKNNRFSYIKILNTYASETIKNGILKKLG